MGLDYSEMEEAASKRLEFSNCEWLVVVELVVELKIHETEAVFEEVLGGPARTWRTQEQLISSSPS